MSKTKKKFEWLPTCTRDDNGSIFTFYAQGHLKAWDFFEQLWLYNDFQEWLEDRQLTRNDLEELVVSETLEHTYLFRSMHGCNYGPSSGEFGWSALESDVSKRGHTPVTKWDVSC